MIIVNGFQPLTIITKCSILDVAAVLDLRLVTSYIHSKLRMIQLEQLRLHTSSKHKEMHPKHVEHLKSRLKDHNVGPFEDSSTTCVRTGLESNFRALQVLFLNHFHALNLNHTLNHIFIPSITSMPLSIASADSSSYQSDKAGFRIML